MTTMPPRPRNRIRALKVIERMAERVPSYLSGWFDALALVEYKRMHDPPRPGRPRHFLLAAMRRTRQPTPRRRTRRVTERKLPFARNGWRL